MIKMPRRSDIESILIIGSGPIVIGQGCEFDYSGAQAVKVLKAGGFRVILVNSNPATIMTDPELADSTYIEPVCTSIIEMIIERERPDALLPTLGGQNALNIAVELAKSGVLERYGVKLIGARVEAIEKAEKRELFQAAMQRAGVPIPKGGLVRSLDQAMEMIKSRVGFPAIIRPSFTLGGSGGGIAYNIEEYRALVHHALKQSPINEALIEESLIGWKEFELELMRDSKDNAVVVCSIENLDPMGVHTGDSITVAPAQTLTDKEYQLMRDYALLVIREIGIDTGGSNIQFAVHPQTGRMAVIEMNPRVSRSSALASKATGFPIAKIASLLAVGYTLDEIPNDVTKVTPSCFEPTLDYVVVKIPRWNFEKFPKADQSLTVQMKSVGEAMAIGRTFKEALQKGLRSLEINRYGLGADGADQIYPDRLPGNLNIPNVERLFYIKYALQRGVNTQRIAADTGVDPWFIEQIAQLLDIERSIIGCNLKSLPADMCLEAKKAGFSDRQLAYLINSSEAKVREYRISKGIKPVYKTVDTCAAEFEAYTPYLYSTYERSNESIPSDNPKIAILGSGPNRIGQGIEFDYCCVRASLALREMGFETIMVNCNPETVSTDYDVSSKLYFEPLTLEDVLNILELEQPYGVVVQLGGQTPLRLAADIKKAGFNILGTSPESIHLAEDRQRFNEVLASLDIRQPLGDTVHNIRDALRVADEIGYPLLVRPSYVLGGRAMAVVYDHGDLKHYMEEAIDTSAGAPILIDQFLEDAYEYDVDCISDGETTVIGGIMHQIEEAGIHSGDSACVIPPYMLFPRIFEQMEQWTKMLARRLNVIGLMNVQFAMRDDKLYVLEVNPRASRTIPFLSKAIGIPLVKLAAKVMAGATLKQLGFTEPVSIDHVCVKEAIFPFIKFREEDPVLGPEMRSTGEVMGIDYDFGRAFAKSQMAANMKLPESGKVFISVNDNDKRKIIPLAKQLHQLGFELLATYGTADAIASSGIPVKGIPKVNEGRPDVVDYIINEDIALLINTPLGRKSQYDDYMIRQAALRAGIPYTTTISKASAAVAAIRLLREKNFNIKSLQEYHQEIR